MRAAKACSHSTCPELQPCPTHHRKPWAGSTRKSQLPHSRRWERIRRGVLDRDPVCKVCNQMPSREVDHITDPNDHRPEALQGICAGCHAEKTQTEARAGRTK